MKISLSKWLNDKAFIECRLERIFRVWNLVDNTKCVSVFLYVATEME